MSRLPGACRRSSLRQRFGRFVKASLLGLGAGLVGAMVWYAIRVVTNYDIGLVAILVGYAVGKTVRHGSGGWGGRGYQVLAVLLTYISIAATYIPVVAEMHAKAVQAKHAQTDAAERKVAKSNPGAAERAPADHAPMETADAPRRPVGAGPHALPTVFLLAAETFVCLAAPIIIGCHSPILLIIYGFGLWEAWKFTARRVLSITGPFQVGPLPAQRVVVLNDPRPAVGSDGQQRSKLTFAGWTWKSVKLSTTDLEVRPTDS